MALTLIDSLDHDTALAIIGFLETHEVANLARTCSLVSKLVCRIHLSSTKMMARATHLIHMKVMESFVNASSRDALEVALVAHGLMVDVVMEPHDFRASATAALRSLVKEGESIFFENGEAPRLRRSGLPVIPVELVGGCEFAYGAPSGIAPDLPVAAAREAISYLTDYWPELRGKYLQAEYPHAKTEKNGEFSRVYLASFRMAEQEDLAIDVLEQLVRKFGFAVDVAICIMHKLFSHILHIDPRAVPRTQGSMLPAREALKVTVDESCAPQRTLPTASSPCAFSTLLTICHAPPPSPLPPLVLPPHSLHRPRRAHAPCADTIDQLQGVTIFDLCLVPHHAFAPTTGWVKAAYAKLAVPLYSVLRVPLESLAFSAYLAGGLVTVNMQTGTLVRLTTPPTPFTLVIAHRARTLDQSGILDENTIEAIIQADDARKGDSMILVKTHLQPDPATALIACNELIKAMVELGKWPKYAAPVFDRLSHKSQATAIIDMYNGNFLLKMGMVNNVYIGQTKEQIEARSLKWSKRCACAAPPRFEPCAPVSMCTPLHAAPCRADAGTAPRTRRRRCPTTCQKRISLRGSRAGPIASLSSAHGGLARAPAHTHATCPTHAAPCRADAGTAPRTRRRRWPTTCPKRRPLRGSRAGPSASLSSAHGGLARAPAHTHATCPTHAAPCRATQGKEPIRATYQRDAIPAGTWQDCAGDIAHAHASPLHTQHIPYCGPSRCSFPWQHSRSTCSHDFERASFHALAAPRCASLALCPHVTPRAFTE